MMMRTLATLLALVAALVTLAACGDDDADEGGGKDVLPIVYERSGGIAGISERLRIEADGAGSFSSFVAGKEREDRIELTTERLERLRELLQASPAGSLPDPDPETVCADCFVHTLSYGGDTWTWDDAELPPEAAEIIGELDAIAGVDGAHPGA